MRYLFTFLLLLSVLNVKAQEGCGFDIAHNNLLSTDSNYANQVQQMNAQWTSLQNAMNNPMGNYVYNGYGQEYVIPVVVHVIHTGGSVGTIYNPADSVIENAIEYLNEVYEATYASYPDTNSGGVRFPVRFELAKRDPSGCGYSSGIIRVNGSSVSGYSTYGVKLSGSSGPAEGDVKALSRYDNHSYYNIWVVNKIDSNDGTFGSFTAGYAYFPGATDTIDGTVILATRMKSGFSTLPHEIGHAFNLYHTFEGDGGGGSCPSNTSCSSQGDFVCDTDPHRRNSSSCPSNSATNICTGLAWSNNFTHKNIMDYSTCRDRFSSGQRTRWLTALTSFRPGLGTSIGAIDTGTNVTSNSCSFTTSNPGNSYNIGPARVTLNDMDVVTRGGYSQDNDQVYVDRSCAQRATVIAGQSYTLSVKTEGPNRQKVEVYIDYNDNGSFTSGELVYSHSGTVSGDETHSTTYSVPTTGITTCKPLRMRVLTDFISATLPTNGCGNFATGGQAEDYSVYIRPASDTVTITASGDTTICTSDTANFSVSASKSLTSPSYQWYLNSQPVGTNSSSYAATGLTAGTYYVRCKVTYTGACYTDSTLTDARTLIVSGSTVTPSVSIASNQGASICTGTSVTFTATPTNGGSSPTYQWRLNGGNVGTNSTTYVNATLSNGDQVDCIMTSNAACASPTKDTSSVITMTVTGTVTPSVSIASNQGSSICSGTNVTFTATPTNGGTSPTYQWKLNGSNVGSGGTTYSNSSLSNGDIITCVMTSNAACASPATATSSGITMVVTASVTPSVSISSNQGTSICTGTSVTFTATPTNGGTSPTYQWKVNGSNVGSGGTTYTTSSLSNGDAVTCVITSNATCASPTSATSNTITMTVSGSVTPSVSIASNQGTTICTGASVTFTATPTNGGTSPTYQWKLNGSNVGSGGTTYTTTSLSNGDAVTCEMTSNAACASPTSATSNSLTMTVNGNVTPSVSIASNQGTSICSGTSVTFTATPTNGGSTPTYQWKLNGSNVGSGGTTYTTTSLSNGDAVTCVMTSNATCASPTSATSNSITMTVTGTVTPSVSIASNQGASICTGTSVTFTATPTNGGSTPTYQWKLNGSNVGSGGTTYTTSSLTNGDAVTCEMTSNATCASPTSATSNTITMTVSGSVTPSVSIASNQGTSICSGTSVTFTVTPTNGGAAPTYQWKLNGSNVGSGGTTYITSSLTNGDVVTCEMTSNAACASPTSATSNSLTMTVSGSVTPSVSIASSHGISICTGTNVTFTATPVNGGTSPSYQWKLNGGNVGSNSSTYANASLSNGDIVSCVMTSNATCATTSTATSNSLTMTVSGTVSSSVSIASNQGTTICAGTNTTFTATPTNGGATPTYQWTVNSTNVGTNSATYSTTGLSNNDTVRCMMTSSITCASPASATSNSIVMGVTANVTPSVSISSDKGSAVCKDSSVTFTATPTNGGTSPTYQWKVNGSNVGSGGTTYATSSLTSGDIVTCVMTSNETCVTSSTATSNSITMTVATPSVSMVTIAVSPNDTICDGQTAMFTATPTNGGTSPTYQWRLNSSNVGSNSSTYSTAGLSNSDQVSCIMTSNAACVVPVDTSNVISMTVKPNLTASVTTAVSPNDTVCAGTSVTFTATPTNSGSSPTYQWKVNGTNAGTNSNTYTTTGSANNDVVTVEMTSNEMCLAKAKDTSSGITMTVNPNLTPGVSIAATGSSICAGTSVTFTATPTNGGASPSYQWKVNGTNVGTNSATYTSSTLSNGDVVTCVMTSSEACLTTATATSNGITMSVTANVTPAVSVAVSPNDTICDGTSVTFTATPTNGGATPTYQWKLNGSNVGSGGTTYTTSSLSNGDVVTVVMTSSLTCVTSATATSTGITMTVNPNLTPNVTAAVSPNDTICDGASVTFTATPTNGGATPAYQWKVNGTNVGANSNTYTTASSTNNDVVTVVLTSSEACVTRSMDTSNAITMTVIQNVTPVVIIGVSPNDSICPGTSVTYTATPTNGGVTPSYQWRVNGNNVGANSTTYTTTGIQNGDAVSAIMTSSIVCVTKQADTSNTINMTVFPQTIPTINIAANTGTTVCRDGEVTFSSNITGGGTTQSYQWRLNGVDITGATSTTYFASSVNNADVYTCRLDITATCPAPDSAISNPLTMTVVDPTVDVQVSPGDTLCNGVPAMFNISATNVGASPKYQWILNGNEISGATSNMFTMLNVNNGDIMTAEFRSSSSCINGPVTEGDSVTMTIRPTTAPAASITANPGNVLSNGQLVYFTASVNVPSAQYQWYVNGQPVAGATGIMYTITDPQDGDSVYLWIKTDDTCRTPDTAISNHVVLQVGVNVRQIPNVVFDDVQLVPNPNKGTFNLKGTLATALQQEIVTVEVVNALGKVVYREQVELRQYELDARIELGDKAHNGLHMIRLHAEGRTQILKFIVNR